jgi:hypothetical protein
MASCAITNGLTLPCGANFVGGVEPEVYVGLLSDLLTPIDVTSAAVVTGFSFRPYKGFKKLQSRKKQFAAGYNVAKAPGGEVSYDHTVNLKLFSGSVTDDRTLEELAEVNDAFFVVVERNRTIKIYGGQQGCEMTEGTQNTGNDSKADTAHNYTFVAEGENFLPKRFLFQNYDASLARLDQLVV